MLKDVLGDNVMSHAQVYEWHKQFSEDREEAKDDKHPGQSVIARTEGICIFNREYK